MHHNYNAVHSCLASAVEEEEEEARRRYSSESIECFIQWLSWGRWVPVGAAGDSGWTDEGVWPGCQVRLNEWNESHRSRWVGEQGQTDSMRKRDEKCHPRKQRFALPKHNCTVELAAGAPQSHPSSTPRWRLLTRKKLCLILELKAGILLEIIISWWRTVWPLTSIDSMSVCMCVYWLFLYGPTVSKEGAA